MSASIKITVGPQQMAARRSNKTPRQLDAEIAQALARPRLRTDVCGVCGETVPRSPSMPGLPGRCPRADLHAWKPTLEDAEILRVVQDRLLELGLPGVVVARPSASSDPDRVDRMYYDTYARMRRRIAEPLRDDPTIAQLWAQLTPLPRMTK